MVAGESPESETQATAKRSRTPGQAFFHLPATILKGKTIQHCGNELTVPSHGLHQPRAASRRGAARVSSQSRLEPACCYLRTPGGKGANRGNRSRIGQAPTVLRPPSAMT